MDFFEAQDQARRKTWKLILLYSLAVATLIVAVYLVALFLFAYQQGGIDALWNPPLFVGVAGFTIFLIMIGTVTRVMQLRRGGAAVAEMLGGRKLNPSTNDFKEKQLRNVVEEMSIASGLPVPDIYILDNETSINAFAAGYGTRDAAVGVTRGALDQLSRDELQGVIAHEFSHIFNGDMRINIRLIGILNGILLLHLMGMILMRSSFFAGRGRSSGQGGKSGGGAIAILLMGLALIIIGYIGMIFGRMIQAAVSRQREYLADAAAVQYTRNPDGLAGALRKIASKKGGSKVEDGHAMELSHLFFANSYKSALSSLLATHPPIEKRIKAISPYSEGEGKSSTEKVRERVEKHRVETPKAEGSIKGGSKFGALGEIFSPELMLAAFGTVGQRDLQYVKKMMGEVPDDIKDAVHNPLEAEATIYGLLLSGDDDINKSQMETIQAHCGEEVFAAVKSIKPKLTKVKPEWKLFVVDMAIPALKQMSKKQYGEFRETIETLIKADEQVSIFEFALEKVVIHSLDAEFTNEKEPKIEHHNLKPLGRELSLILSAVVHASDGDKAEAWKAALTPLEKIKPDDLEFLEPAECSMENLDGAIEAFAKSARPVQKYLLSAMIHAISSDGNMSRKEIELLRAISISIDCPMPVFGS